MNRRLLLLAVLAAALAQGLLLWVLLSALQEGRLVDIDGYTRLLRVRTLHETGQWQQPVELRANAPFGVTSHWTRPLDALLLAGARALAPALGFERALFWWGVVLSPLLYVLAAALLAWISRWLLSPRARLLMLLALPLQLALLMDSAPGLPDHHALLVLVEVAALGATLRLLVGPPRRGVALAAGALLALGVWVSAEFLLAAALLCAGLGLGWMLRGGDRAQRNAQHALGFAGGLALALLLERAPAELAQLEVDRLSLVHLTLAMAYMIFWSLIALGTRRREWSVRGRWIATSIAAVPLLVAAVPIARRVLSDAEMASDPLTDAFNRAGSGFGSLWPVDAASAGQFFVYLGAAVFALPFALALARRTWKQPVGEAWFVVGLAALGHVLAALALARLSAYAELLLLIPLGALAAAWLERAELRRERPGRVAVAVLGTAALLLAPLAAGACLVAWRPVPALGADASADARAAADAQAEAERHRPLDLRALYPLLDARPGLGERPLTILCPPRDAPELLYRTPHRTVAYPHHRGLASVRACLDFFDTPSEAAAHALVRERAVELLIVPREATPASFVGRLAGGELPGWLRRIDAPQADAAGVLLFAVVE